ncbi:hypothetical protein M422DRAFT_179573 [Sphaerobolus stellatus SS14]|uniref:Dehydrogenase E1 component domain-containing protein n=1 Tax=Sphaerobolus stellatus (strain SS14) TaxID=990650 RepID=A0A0C9VG27_SPHS4|nr:hypothetical protein M422DRAFT_179573 [Sphaerobolus stellatus SS14]
MSFLEAVNPIALGLARAKQYALLKSPEYTSKPNCTLGNLPHYTSGGSVHLIVNIGYTTPASGARSSQYCSDVAKIINAPILHVNGDYPEDVTRAMEIAFKYRNSFRKVCFPSFFITVIFTRFCP